MILNKLILLREILYERLPYVGMWNNVGIFLPGDKFPKGTILDKESEPDEGKFTVLWYNKKREDNPHPCRFKHIPLTIDDLNAVIKRQREKLRTESINS